MDERRYVDWDYSVPGISFCEKSGRVTIFKTTLDAIGYPEFYRFLYNADHRKLAIEPCEIDSPGAYALVNVKKDKTYDVSSVDFVRMMYRENRWDRRISYRIAGIAYSKERAVEFDLTKALEIHEGRVAEKAQSNFSLDNSHQLV